MVPFLQPPALNTIDISDRTTSLTRCRPSYAAGHPTANPREIVHLAKTTDNNIIISSDILRGGLGDRRERLG